MAKGDYNFDVIAELYTYETEMETDERLTRYDSILGMAIPTRIDGKLVPMKDIYSKVKTMRKMVNKDE